MQLQQISIQIEVILAHFFQMHFASLRNLSRSSSTDSTMTPPSRSVGASTRSTVSLGSTSMPRSAKLITCTGFFFALRMPYTLANRGVFKRRSTVKIAGRETSICCRPKSTSRVTIAEELSPANSISELNVALGISIIVAKICPV